MLDIFSILRANSWEEIYQQLDQRAWVLGQRHECWWLGSFFSVDQRYPDSKVHGANMGPTWVLSAQDGPHVSPMNLAIRVAVVLMLKNKQVLSFRGMGLVFGVGCLGVNCPRAFFYELSFTLAVPQYSIKLRPSVQMTSWGHLKAFNYFR